MRVVGRRSAAVAGVGETRLAEGFCHGARRSGPVLALAAALAALAGAALAAVAAAPLVVVAAAPAAVAATPLTPLAATALTALP